MDIQSRCDKIAAECQTPLFRKMKSLNAITKRNCSQIIQESGDFLWIPFLCPGYQRYHHWHHRNNVRITPLWYLNYRPRSATPERGARGLTAACRVHLSYLARSGPGHKTSANEWHSRLAFFGGSPLGITIFSLFCTEKSCLKAIELAAVPLKCIRSMPPMEITFFPGVAFTHPQCRLLAICRARTNAG